jgi:trehalose-6-phosphate synthase
MVLVSFAFRVIWDLIMEHWPKNGLAEMGVVPQDYHLLLVPAMLRKLLPDAQIGFFLHIAFPSSEV